MTSDELSTAVHEHVADCDVLVMCAAVSDYKPAKSRRRNWRSTRDAFTLELDRDARHSRFAAAQDDRAYLVVGFAAQTHDLEANALTKTAREKLRRDRRE